MKRWAVAMAVTGLVVGSAGCPPAGECQTNEDCAAGEICATGGQCKAKGNPVPFKDGGALDLLREDRAPEDAIGEDLGSRDGVSSIDGGIYDGGTQQQVNAFVTCRGPRALALNPNEGSLFVGCEGDNMIKVYRPVTGVQARQLTSLPATCKPRALHLLESRSQLWVGCGDVSQMVYNVDPTTGATNETGFSYGGSGLDVHFASSSDRLVWVDASGPSYHLRQIGTGTTSQAVGESNVLNLGSGVAMTASGDFYLTNSTTNSITRRDKTGGVLNPAFTSSTSSNLLIAQSVSRGVLLVASNGGYSRLYTSSGSQIGGAQNYGVGTNVLALIVRADGEVAYLSRYNQNTSTSTIDKISMDPARSTPTIASQAVIGCFAADLAVATDGRVFVACYLTNQVQVLQLGP